MTLTSLAIYSHLEFFLSKNIYAAICPHYPPMDAIHQGVGDCPRSSSRFGGDCYCALNPFMPTVPTFAVRETDVSRHNGGTSGAPLKPHRDDSALRALLRGGVQGGHPRFPIMPRDVSLSDSKCWNLVAKTQRREKMS